MTRQELRLFLREWFCICGSPALAAARLRDVLALHPLYNHDNREGFKKLLPDEGFQELFLYTLEHFGLTEHGSLGAGCGWLTDKGRAVLAALTLEMSDNYESLMERSCVHGYAIEGEHQNCQQCAEMRKIQYFHWPLNPILIPESASIVPD